MKAITQLPNLATSADMLFISIELNAINPYRVDGLTKDIRRACEEGRIKDAIEFIVDQVNLGHREALEWSIGNKLLTKILNKFGTC